jgi:DNA-directed RNA polymerase I subunit RPA12
MDFKEETDFSIFFLLTDTVPKTIISESKPSSFPSALRAKRSAIQTLTAADKRTEALTEKDCPQCGRKEMYFTTVQLRSADEGSTVFFTCVCGYKYEASLFSVLTAH